MVWYRFIFYTICFSEHISFGILEEFGCRLSENSLLRGFDYSIVSALLSNNNFFSSYAGNFELFGRDLSFKVVCLKFIASLLINKSVC